MDGWKLKVHINKAASGGEGFLVRGGWTPGNCGGRRRLPYARGRLAPARVPRSALSEAETGSHQAVQSQGDSLGRARDG